MNTEVILLAVGGTWIILSFFYWRHYYLGNKSAFVSYDRVFLALILVLVITRLASVTIDYSLLVRPFSVLEVVSIFNLHYFYPLIPAAVLLAHQFYSFNVKLNRHWAEESFPAIWYGIGLTVPIVCVQIVRAISLEWPRQFLGLHIGHLTVLAISFALAWYLKKNKLLLRLGYLVYLFQLLGFVLTYHVSQTISMEELNLYFSACGIAFVLIFLPYIPYNLAKFVRRNELVEKS